MFDSSATPWTVARQAPLSMGLPRQEYWSGLPFLSPADLPDPGIKPMSLTSPALVHRFFTISSEPSGKPKVTMTLGANAGGDLALLMFYWDQCCFR